MANLVTGIQKNIDNCFIQLFRLVDVFRFHHTRKDNTHLTTNLLVEIGNKIGLSSSPDKISSLNKQIY